MKINILSSHSFIVILVRRYFLGLLVFLSLNSSFAQTNWTKIYETINPVRNSSSNGEIQYVAGFGKTGGAASAFTGSFDRVKIRLECNVSNTFRWAEVEFDTWSGLTVQDLQVPDYGNSVSHQRNVNNIKVSSNMPGVNLGNFALGRIEMWRNNYATSTSGLTPAGNGGDYDWDDQINVTTNGYGCFQVHNVTSGYAQTILAWNHHQSGGQPDLGIGNAPSGHPDWTFNTSNGSANFKVQIFVGTSIISTQPSSTAQTICLNGASTALSVGALGTSISYQWYSNSVNSNSGGTLISGATSSSYTPPTNVSGTKYYYVVVTNSLGSTTSAVSGGITVSPLSLAGTASSNQTICSGVQPSNITLSGNTGTIEWQVSSDNINFTNISGATSSPLTSAQMGTLTSTRYYRAIVTSGACSAVTSNVVTVTVTPLPTMTSTTPGSICGSGPVLLGASATGTINWYSALTGGSSIGTGTSYTTPSISTTTTYYVDVTANGCTSTPRAAVIATINPLPLPATNTPSSIIAEVLVVGGGGSGGYRHAGGGGAGGVVYDLAFVINPGNIPVTVGNGGVGNMVSGQNSVFSTITAYGGGGGGTNGQNGLNGGSGGGGSNGTLGGTGISGQGNKGGNQNDGNGCCFANGAGGGGAGAAGANTTGASSSDGGIGIPIAITGSTVYYGGGGGGGTATTTSMSGGNGGGGAGGRSNSMNGSNGAANTGGGGGGGGANGSSSGNGGNGGSGVVIIRYSGTPIATGGTITQSGGYTIHTFTSSGTFAYAGSISSATVPNIISCSASAVTFTGTVSAGLTLDWYDAAIGGNLLSQGTTTYTTPVISTTTTYYVAVRNTTTGCVSATRLAVTATINSASTITPNQTICSGVQPANITLTGNTGTIQWQVSSDNISFTNISGATSSPLTSAQMGVLTATRYYRAIVTSGACSAATSNVVTVTVTPLPTMTSTTPGSNCGTGPVLLGASATGTINWYAALTGGSSLGTGTSYTTPSISTTTTYYVDVTSNGCTSSPRTAVIATINALPMAATNTPSSINLEVLAVGAGGGGGGGDGPLGAGGGSGSAVTTTFVVTLGNYAVSVGGGGSGGTGCAVNAGAGAGGSNGGGTGGMAGGNGCSGGGGGGGGWSGIKLGTTTYVIAGGGAGGGGSNEGTANNVDSPGGNTSPNGNTVSNNGGNGTNFSGDGGGGGGGGGGYLGGNGQSGLTSNGQASGGTSYANPSNTSTSIVNGNSGKSEPNGSAGGAAVSVSNSSNFGYANNYGSGAAGASNNGASNNGSSGIVIIRYAGTPIATGGTITQSGGYTIHTFTSSGTFAFTGSTSSANIPNVSSCGASAVTFTGTVSAGLTLDWYDAATGGNLLSQGTTTFTTPVISTTTTYYVAVRNTTTGCVSATRLAVTATINSASTVTPNQTICMGATPASITLTSASGTIQWQSSTNNSTFTNIAGQTGSTLTGATMGALNSTMYYRAVITNGACVGNSPVHTVNVTNPTISASPVSTDLVWNGKVSNDWTNANNWWSYNGTAYGTAAAIPSSSTNVFIQGTSACVLNQPTIATAAGYSKNITIETGATLTMNTGSLTVNGNWSKNGSFVAGTGTVTMNGTSAQTIAGNGTTTFNNLTINNTSTGVSLSSPVEVQATLTMTNGNIATSSTNLLTLGVGSVGTLSWTAGTVVGPFQRWFASATNTGNASGLFPVGTATTNRWALLEYSVAPTTAGYLSAEFKAVDPTTTSAGTNGITLVDQYNWQLDNIATDGYWEIIPTTIDGGNYNLTLRSKDFASIVNTFDVCRVIKSPNNHVSWILDGTHGSTTGSQADFTISRTGMSGFSYFAIAYPTAAPLPVELISFQANCLENQTVSITWSTASEHNSSYFKVEKSRDGMNWTVLSQVEGAGNSTTLLNYEIIDSEKTVGVVYYRLTQVDFDGASETFNIASVNCGGNAISESLKVYPNPSEGEFYLEFDNSSTNNEVVLSMFDLEGKAIYSETKTIEKGSNIFHMKNLNAAPGIYFVEVRMGEVVSRVKHSIR